MLLYTSGVQAIGGTSSSASPLSVRDADRPALCVYAYNNQAGFAYTGGGTWDELIAAATIPENATEMEVFLAGADDVDIGFGAAASEDDEFHIIPGGNGRIPVQVTAGTRVAIRGNGVGGTTGTLIINFYGPTP